MRERKSASHLLIVLSLGTMYNKCGFAVPLNFLEEAGSAVGFGNNSVSLAHRSECRYKGLVFDTGVNVPTDQPCLFCHCKGGVVVCKLRMCPSVPDVPPPGCILLQKANKCCSQLVCQDNQLRKLSREQRLPSSSNQTLPSPPPHGGYCVHDGTVYAEGSAMRSSTLCQHCFCIRGQVKCSSPQCLTPQQGCKPKFRSYACCPTNYDCHESKGSGIVKTFPTTPLPQFLKGCNVQGRFISEGEPVLPLQLQHQGEGSNGTSLGTLCQTCFCMGGVVHCSPLQCAKSIEGCSPVIQDGHCCPDRYECDKKTLSVGANEVMASRQSGAGKKVEAGVTKPPEKVIHPTTIFPPPNMVEENRGFPKIGGFKNFGGSGRKSGGIEAFPPSFYEEDEAKEDRSEFTSSSEAYLNEDDPSTLIFEDPVSEHSNSDSEETTSTGVEDTTTTTTSTGTDSDIVTMTTDLATAEDNESIVQVTQLPTTFKVSSTTPRTPPNKTTQKELTTSTPGSRTIKPTSISSPTSKTGKLDLEFIAFGVEDAVNAPSMNETRYEVYPGKTVDLNFDPPAPVNPPATFLISKDNVYLKPLKLQSPPLESPKLTGRVGVDHPSKNLVPILVSSNEDQNGVILEVPVQTSLYNNGYYNQGGLILEDDSKEQELVITQAEPHQGTTPPSLPATTTTTRKTTVKSSTGIPIRNYEPNVGVGEAIPSPSSSGDSPSRTWSKFGVQDSSHFPYSPQSGSLGGFIPVPTSGASHGKVPYKESRLHYTPYEEGDDPFEEASYEETLSLEEEEEVSPFLPSIPTWIPKPPVQQMSTISKSTASVTSNLSPSNKSLKKSSSGSKVIVNSKPLRRPEAQENPLGFKPVVAFPFMIGKGGGSLSGGLKLSGCNIYGKMYGVGQVIHELSSLCVQCQCSEMGVQCSELQC